MYNLCIATYYYTRSNLYNVWNVTSGTCIVQRASSVINVMLNNYLLCMFKMMALLKYMTALLEYIDLFVFDVVNIFQCKF